MSWRDILKIALDKKGNSYGRPQWLDGPLTGPAMVLAEKRETPIYVIYLDDEDGIMYDNLEEAKRWARGNKIITVSPTDKKTLMTGLDLYRVIAEEQDFDEQTDDVSPEALRISADKYLRGELKSYTVFNALENASYATQSFSGYYSAEDKEKVKEQLKEVMEELDYMRTAY